MPLLTTAAPPTPEPPAPPVRRSAKRIIWTDADGNEWQLSAGQGYANLTGRSGFGMPIREVIVDRMPSGSGMLHAIRDSPRTLLVPLMISGSTQEEYLQRYRGLQRAFSHKRGGVDVPGRLTVALPDGQRRSIAAYYNGGLEPVEDVLDDLISLYQFHPNLEFLALEPYWEGGTIELEWAQAEAGTFFPILPVNLASSQVLGVTTATNPGGADAYPVWEIDGPGTVVAANDTTGKEWAFTVSIPTGTTVTVDTRPPEIAPETGLTAEASDGTDWFENFADFPQLWSLEPGVNDLRLEVTGVDANTAVRMTATIRHQAGW